MSAADPCAGVQERLEEALLARRAAAPPDLAHAEGCPVCGRCRDDLLALGADLDAAPAPEPPAAVVHAARRRAAEELRRGAVRRPLPQGYGRELLRLLGGATAAFPAVLLWNAAVLALGAELLPRWLPPALVSLVGVGYAVAAGGTVALVFGALPVVAHGRVQQRRLAPPEVTA